MDHSPPAHVPPQAQGSSQHSIPSVSSWQEIWQKRLRSIDSRADNQARICMQVVAIFSPWWSPGNEHVAAAAARAGLQICRLVLFFLYRLAFDVQVFFDLFSLSRFLRSSELASRTLEKLSVVGNSRGESVESPQVTFMSSPSRRLAVIKSHLETSKVSWMAWVDTKRHDCASTLQGKMQQFYWHFPIYTLLR